jgi:hypothetical protein
MGALQLQDSCFSCVVCQSEQRSRMERTSASHSLACCCCCAVRCPRPTKTWPGSSTQQQAAQQQRSGHRQCAAHAAQPASAAPQSNPVLRWFKWLPDRAAGRLVADAWALLYSNIWAVVAIYLAKDAAAFLLHRLAHRLTNHSESPTAGQVQQLQHLLQQGHMCVRDGIRSRNQAKLPCYFCHSSALAAAQRAAVMWLADLQAILGTEPKPAVSTHTAAGACNMRPSKMLHQVARLSG